MEEKLLHEQTSACTINKPEEQIPSFEGAQVKVVLNGQLLDLTTGIKIHENVSLSTEDFYKTIPELHDSKLASVKHVKAVIVLEALIANDYVIPSGSEIEFIAMGEYGNVIGKRIHDVSLIKKSVVVDANRDGAIVMRYILVSSEVSPFNKIIFEEVE